MIGDGQDAPSEIVLLRPKMQQWIPPRTADFPGEHGEGSKTTSVFAHFDGAVSRKFAQAGFQFGGEFHAQDYRGYTYKQNYSFAGANCKPLMRGAKGQAHRRWRSRGTRCMAGPKVENAGNQQDSNR